MGSLATLPFIALILWLSPGSILEWSLGFSNIFLPLGLLIAVLSYPSVRFVIAHEQNDDPGKVVIDEVAGQSLAFAFVSPLWLQQHLELLLFGFAFFRFFDILKPLGIKKLERLPGAVGVISDDLLGGIYAGLVLKALTIWFY